jgi:hypothetical protein
MNTVSNLPAQDRGQLSVRGLRTIFVDPIRHR